jgi:hemerythrin-like metal-binding protein
MSSVQTQVAWSDEYALDLPEIDEQHKFLFRLIDDVWRTVVNKADRDTTLGVVGELERYTVTHFAAEEAFMREQQYSLYHEHRAEHEKFVARIALEKASVKAGRPAALARADAFSARLAGAAHPLHGSRLCRRVSRPRKGGDERLAGQVFQAIPRLKAGTAPRA